MHLLIVDDEDIIRRGLQTLDWASVGITEVSVAPDGAQARDLLQKENVDVVVSDIRMPGLDGLELARYVATHAGHTRMILLTGFSDFAYAQQAIRHGVLDYLLKPIKPDELLQVVRGACRSLQLEVEQSRIVQEYHQSGDALVVRQQILQGFRGLGESVSGILFYLAEHYMENITLAALAEEFHFSTIHISRMIKKETGFSFLDILTGIRLQSAARLLRESGLRVCQICERVGIGDQRYFSKVFKNIYGSTPLEYRKQPTEPKSHTLLELLRQMTDNK